VVFGWGQRHATHLPTSDIQKLCPLATCLARLLCPRLEGPREPERTVGSSASFWYGEKKKESGSAHGIGWLEGYEGSGLSFIFAFSQFHILH